MKTCSPFRRSSLCLLVGLLASLAGVAQAQVYKWVDKDGKVIYSDTPPPPNVRQLEKRATESTLLASNFPADLAAAVSMNPITLYTASGCAPCADARNFLKQAGVPFQEKTVSTAEDAVKLKEAGGDQQLPLMLVKRVRIKGFERGEWRQALTQAGYPETSKLPADYRYPNAEPAAPAPAKEETAAPKSAPSRPVRQDGFRF